MNQQKRLVQRFSISLLVSFLLWFIFSFFEFYRDLERIGIDFRFRNWASQIKPSDSVVLIDIDEPSLKNLAKDLGRWPWPRYIYKDMIEFIGQGSPKGLLFDILFTEPEYNKDQIATCKSQSNNEPAGNVEGTPSETTQQNDKANLIDVRRSDRELALASQNLKVVSHAMKFEVQSASAVDQVNILPQQVKERAALTWRTSLRPRTPEVEFKDANIPNDLVLAQSPYLHVANAKKDSDGIMRRMPLFFKYQNEWYPSMTLRALTLEFKKVNYEYRPGYLIVYDQDLIKFQIPLDRDDLFLLNYYRPEDTNQFSFKSFAMDSVLAANRKLLSGEVDDPEKLKPNPLSDFSEKIILIGGSAAGLEDLKATPINSVYPGVLLHATAISNILKGHFLRIPPRFFMALLVVSVLAIISLGMAFLESLILRVGLAVATIFLYVGFSLYLFKYKSLEIDLVMPVIFFVGTLGEGLAYLTFIEGKRRKNLTGTLSKYLSPEVTKYLVDHGVNPSAEVGKKQELSILFSDVRGFTSLSEKIPAEKLVTILNDYLGRMTEIVFSRQGTLDKFIGDAIMAFWGAPLENPKHAMEAVLTALNMIETLEKANVEYQSKFQLQLHVGIGINTGSVIVGNIGCDRRLDYTVIGDNVNLASRLEGLTKYYHVPIIVGQRTQELISNEIICRPIDWVQVKGKNEPTPIYQPLGKISAISEDQRNLNNLYSVALKHYKGGEFKEAEEGFHKAYEKFPQDPLSQMMAERCRELAIEAPKDWQGIYRLKNK